MADLQIFSLVKVTVDLMVPVTVFNVLQLSVQQQIIRKTQRI